MLAVIVGAFYIYGTLQRRQGRAVTIGDKKLN